MFKIYEYCEIGRYFNFFEFEKLLKCKMVVGVIEWLDLDYYWSFLEFFGNILFYLDNFCFFVEFNVVVDCDWI